MGETVTYRPRFMPPGQLRKIVEKMHYNLNGFIEEAIKEKIVREQEGLTPEAKLSDAVSKVVYEHMGWSVATPSKKEERKIDDSIRRHKAGKSKMHTWTGKFD